MYFIFVYSVLWRQERNDIVKAESPAPLCRQFPLSSVLAKMQ